MSAIATARRVEREEWAQSFEAEFEHVDFGDKRLNRRLPVLATSFFRAPESSIPRACGSWKSSKAAYRFFSNKKVTPEAIYKPHRLSTLKRARSEPVVLAIADTTQLDYTDHLATDGLGPLGDLAHHGLLFQPVLVATPERVPLGIAGEKTWIRERDDFAQGDTPEKRKRSISEKESVKWLDSLETAERFKRDLGDSPTRVVSVFDREGDVFEVLAKATEPESKCGLLVRASYDRRVEHPQHYIWAQMEKEPEVGTLEIKVPRGPGSKERDATLSVKTAKITILRPKGRKVETDRESVSIHCVYVHEESPPEHSQAVSWMLLTTEEVDGFEDACRMVQWYCVRWSIELLFRILKSGCKAEERQLETAERLKNCLALDVIVAWQILYLTTLGRELPDLPCTVIFEEHEWQAAWAFVHQSPNVPQETPTLGVMVRLIGRLGGHLGRKSDGHPGQMTLWRGLQRLPDMAGMWLVCRGSG